MGNCQAAEAATVVIEHPGGRVERVYWSITASQVMAANPGHYVAVIITSTRNTTPTTAGATATPVKQLKLLRPDDTLNIGHVYRLVSFEEVLKEFASKKHVKLSRLLLAHKERSSSKRRGGGGRGGDRECSPATVQVEAQAEVAEEEMAWVRSSGGGGSGGGGITRRGGGHGQWRPALQSIAEIGS